MRLFLDKISFRKEMEQQENKFNGIYYRNIGFSKASRMSGDAVVVFYKLHPGNVLLLSTLYQ